MKGIYSTIKAFMRFEVIVLAFLILGCLVTTAQARQSFYFLEGETVKVYSMDGVFQESFQLNPYPNSQQGYRGFTVDAAGLTSWTSHEYEYDYITGQAIRNGGGGGVFPINDDEWGYCGGVAVDGNTLYLGRYQHYSEPNPYRIELYNISTGAFTDQWYLSNFYPDLMQFVNGYLIVAENLGTVRFYSPTGSVQGEFDVSYLYPGHSLTAMSADSNYVYVQFYAIGTNKAFAFDWSGNRQVAHDVEFPGLGTPNEGCIASAPDVPIIMPDAASIDFGLQTADTQSDELLTITNVGVENLTVTGVSLSDTTNYDFSTPSLPFTLAPGQSQVITVSFIPQTTGLINATLSIFSDSQNISGSDLVIALTGESLSSVAYVDSSADGLGDGSTWTNAFTSIAAAVASPNVLEGSSIWVREGTYSLGATIDVNKAVSIYGGFPRNVSNPGWSDRDWENHPSIIDGNAAVRCVHITANATLDGFTITNGLENTYTNGGGVLVYAGSSDPELHAAIANCTITNNRTVSAYGGGIFVYYYVDSCSITNCTITGNQAHSGGGIGAAGTNVVISGCTITGNSATSSGGGIYNTHALNGPPVIENCIISNNTAGSSGGGICNDGCSTVITNCVVSGNSLINQESWEYGGSGIENFSTAAPTITNCTIANNHGYGGGFFDETDGVAILNNCILWGNDNAQIYLYRGAVATVTFCDVDQEGYGAPGGLPDEDGNIRLDPLFMNAAEGNYALRLGSPCIDAGTDVGAPDEDILGIARPQSDGYDMGAYEYDGIIYNGPWYVDGDATVSGDGMSWAGAFASIEEAIEIAGIDEEILVKAGTYALANTIYLEKAVKLYGGFTGDGMDRGIEGTPSVIDGQGSLQNCFSITAGATLDGFTITGGNANDYGGGGMYIDGADPVINRCTFTENFASFAGGAIYINGSPRASMPTISNSTFINNSTTTRAGAIGSYRSAPQIEGCVFIGNQSSQGGAIYLQDSAPGPGITNCLFQGNRAGSGGALYLNEYSEQYPMLVVMNCTFSDNRGGNGGAVNASYSDASFTNCIFWNDGEVATYGPEIYAWGSGSPTVSYCDVEGGYSGTGNLNVNPLFIAPGYWDDNQTPSDTADDTFVIGDYHLAGGSPCIDTATATGAPLQDLAGTLRPQGNGYDIGAYEYVEVPDIAAAPSQLDFTVVFGNSSETASITVSNIGALDLVIDGISINDTDRFDITHNTLPITLANGETTQVDVVFTPDAIAFYDAFLTITSNDPDESALVIPVTGEGIAPVQYTITASAGTGGTITPSGDVLVNHAGSQSFTIAANEGYDIADVLVDGAPQGAMETYTFENVTEPHTISASFAAKTYIITASAGVGGSISPASAEVAYGGNQTFTIVPDTGFHVVDVLVDDVSQGTLTSHTFENVTEDHTISAIFAIDTFTITASAGAGGSISPINATVTYGGSQTFAFTPDEHYHVADVLVDGSSVGASSSYTFSNVTVDHSIEVSFVIDTYTLTILHAGDGEGTTTPAAGSYTYDYGTVVDLMAPDSESSLFAGWSGDIDAAGKTVTMNANKSVTATFSLRTFIITASAGDHGNISPAGATNVSYGGSQMFTIAPETGYHVADVLVDGGSVGAVTSYPFTNITDDHTISATFAVNDYTITSTAGAGGTIFPAGPTDVSYGGSLTFEIAALEGYHIDDVVVDSISQGAVSSYTFSDVDTDHTISAGFALDTFTITASSDAGGSISPTSATVTYGGSQSFSITPDAHYHIADVLVDGISVGAVSSYTIENVTADNTISASFAIDTHTLTLTIPENGIVVVSPDLAEYTYGSVVQLSATPDADYLFDGWNGDVADSDADETTVIMDTDKVVEAVFVPDGDNDGVPTSEEQGPDGTDAEYDGNSDGEADAAQANVVSGHAYNDAYITLASPADTTIVNVDVDELPEDAPEDFEFPYGLVSFAIKDVQAGGSTTVEIYLPQGQICDTYYKYDENSDTWEEFLYNEATNTGAVINGNKITLHFIDGQRGDQDGTADGIITDPGAPAVGTKVVPPEDNPPADDDSDSGGCFISSADNGPGAGSLLAACMLLLLAATALPSWK